MSDLMDTYLKDCSSYVSELTYDIGKRVLILVCVNNPDDFVPVIKVTFEGISLYSKETINEEYDDNCMDMVIGINWVRDKVLCIHTDKKEIIIELENEPQSKKIA